MRKLIECHQIFSIRMHRVASGNRKMSDVVTDRNLVDDFPGSEFPFGYCAFDEEARVSIALIVKLRVQRSQTDIDLGLLHMVIVDDRNAILIAGKIFVLNCRLYLLEVEDGRNGLQFPTGDDVLTIGTDINAGRTLAGGNQIDDPGACFGSMTWTPPSILNLPSLIACSAAFQFTAAT